MEKIKAFVKENGFTSLLILLAAAIVAFHGMWFWFAVLLSFFAGRNWEIIIKLWNENKDAVKEKVGDVIEDIKEKVKKD